MKKTILIYLLLGCVVFSGDAQQIFAEIGRVSTVFRYEDSKGEGIDNLFSMGREAYRIGYRRQFHDKFWWTGGLIFNRYAMKGSNPVYNNRFEWDTRYLGLTAGLDFEPYRIKRIHTLAFLSVDPQMLINGTQEVNNQIYDLKGVEQFERMFLFFRGGVGVNYCVDPHIAFTMRYAYGRGLPIGKSSDPESLEIDSHTISIGLLASIRFYDYCHKSHFEKK